MWFPLIHALSSLFFRNKTAYIVGRFINGERVQPFAVPIRHTEAGRLALDTVLLRRAQLEIVFSFSHSYFLVDMSVPSAYVEFLSSIMPGKPKAEIYTSVGLQKQGKNLFYRGLLHHLSHSSDRFIVAPGIRGMVMLVFTLPSFPYVFKLIRDNFPAPKDTTRAKIMEKYQLVKRHDRVGRMADTLEYSSVALPIARLDHALLKELQKEVPSLLEYDGDKLVIKHMYIERRMTPLNLYLHEGGEREIEHGIKEYGSAIKELLQANIFPGDMLYKNFGVTRHGRVVFYDYDEIEYLTDCNVRRVPEPRDDADELSDEPWYTVGPHDIFPETYGPFLLGDPRVRKYFLEHHADFFDPKLWQDSKDRVLEGNLADFFAYDTGQRFRVRYAERFAPERAAPDAATDTRTERAA